MIKKRIWLLPTAIILSLSLTACGGSSGGGKKKTGEFQVKDMKVTADAGNSSDAQPTISVFTADGGKLGLRVNGIDLGDGNGVQKPAISNMSINPTAGGSKASKELSSSKAASDAVCGELATGASGSGDKFDIVVSLDTSGSMGSEAAKFANKIVDFAGALQAQGLDVRFAGVTVGDAFATLRDNSDPDYDGSDYESDTAKGSLGTPPNFDNDERPDTGLTLVSANDMQAFFTEVKDVVGSGQGGGDSPENYLAPIDYFNRNVAFREDAGRFFIAIGDECAHTADTLPGDDLGESNDNTAWLPRDPEVIKNSMINDGVAVNLIWSNTSGSYCDSYSGGYNMRELQKATGGTWTDIYEDVDLTALPAITAVGTMRSTLACTIPDIKKGTSMMVSFDVTVGGTEKWSVTMDL